MDDRAPPRAPGSAPLQPGGPRHPDVLPHSVMGAGRVAPLARPGSAAGGHPARMASGGWRCVLAPKASAPCCRGPGAPCAGPGLSREGTGSEPTPSARWPRAGDTPAWQAGSFWPSAHLARKGIKGWSLRCWGGFAWETLRGGHGPWARGSGQQVTSRPCPDAGGVAIPAGGVAIPAGAASH